MRPNKLQAYHITPHFHHTTLTSLSVTEGVPVRDSVVNTEVKVHVPDAGDVSCWVPARPYSAPTIRERIRMAWDVFTGKADALYWSGQDTR